MRKSRLVYIHFITNAALKSRFRTQVWRPKKWNPLKKELSLILAAFYPSRETSMRASRSPLLPKTRHTVTGF